MRAAGLAPGLVVAALATVGMAGRAAAVEDYDACVGLIAGDAERAERDAAAWADIGGGAAARHCHALALIATGATSAAIDELLDIAAEDPELTPQARADVLVQAGEMLLDEGDGVTARAVGQSGPVARPGRPGRDGAQRRSPAR